MILMINGLNDVNLTYTNCLWRMAFMNTENIEKYNTMITFQKFQKKCDKKIAVFVAPSLPPPIDGN